ncbi:hypothetical protein NL676_002616 [Syzygium grande]|nr:hypothetical protein NL676_002616 [Syzygium grande]
MYKNEKREKRSSEVCEKISHAIRRIARCGQAPNPAQLDADPSIKALDIQSKPEGGHRTTLVLKNGEGKSTTLDLGANKPKETTLSVDQESKRSGHDIDHRFSDYINRTWLKIRSKSSVGRGKNHSPTKDTRHDQFADYITRAKKKLRTTSSIGGGRSK